jgi:small subunit ribosomal protein S9
MAKEKYYGTGRRKEAVARVWIFPGGTGKITVKTVNGKERDAKEYFARDTLLRIINRPFEVTDTLGKFDVWATLKGGGVAAQADALKYGIAKALLAYNPELRPALKKAGLLTRDAREKERKKYGQRGARASYQWSKR